MMALDLGLKDLQCLVNFSSFLMLNTLRHGQEIDNVIEVLQGMWGGEIDWEASIELYRFHTSDSGFQYLPASV
jgi:hypothetical protein